MPLYQFHCPTCKHEFEELLTISRFEEHSMACPLCEGYADHVMGVPTPVGTATRWLSQHGTLLDQFGDTPTGRQNLAARVAVAKRHGYHPSANDVYDPTVATAPGHPSGFLSHTDPAGHVRRVQAEQGVGAEGGLAKAPTPSPIASPPLVPLAADIADNLTDRAIKADPGLAHKRAQVREAVIDKHRYRRRSE